MTKFMYDLTIKMMLFISLSIRLYVFEFTLVIDIWRNIDQLIVSVRKIILKEFVIKKWYGTLYFDVGTA